MHGSSGPAEKLLRPSGPWTHGMVLGKARDEEARNILKVRNKILNKNLKVLKVLEVLKNGSRASGDCTFR